MVLLICMSYMHVILFVGKSWHRHIQATVGLLWGEKIGDCALGGGIELGRVGKRCGRPLESENLY